MRNYIFAGFIVGMLSLAITSQFADPLGAQESEASDVKAQLELFNKVFNRVRESYVEDVDDEALIEAAIDGMLSSLDPHSSYLSPKDFEQMSIQTQGSFGGLGMEVTQEDGFVKVVAPIDDTPAAQAGIQSGDFITHVNGEALLGLTLSEAVGLMRGPVGSEALLKVVRDPNSEPFDVSIIRDTIKLVAVRGRLVGNTAVLRISTFNEQTQPNLEAAIAEQIEAAGGIENLNGFIIDLRNNPGGLLSAAISVTDTFLNEGEIVSTRERDARNSRDAFAQKGDLTQGKPIVVLINRGSASASEIVAGALQDHKRAVIVGTKSFGKGSVQSIMPISDGSAMRLTTARYYTPSGRSIQSLGVSPDIVVDQPSPSIDADDQEDETTSAGRFEADLRGALNNDSLSDEERELIEAERIAQEEANALRAEDYQLAYAIDLLKGLISLQALN